MLCPGPVFSDIVREAFTTKVGEVTTIKQFTDCFFFKKICLI